MKAKYKMTGCARFFIFLVILIPIAYFGSKYLRDTGLWDKFKEKVENQSQNSEQDNQEFPPSQIDIPTDDNDLRDQYGRLRAAYEEQELVLAKHEQTIKNLQQENEALRKRLNDPLLQNNPTISTGTTPQSSPSSSDNPSMDDLLKEADNNLGTSSTKNDKTGGTIRKTIGEWNFTYSGASGVIEFYTQGNKIFSRISIQGDNSINIEELTRNRDRFTVVNSKTGEYYLLIANGNLEAYDQNGYQTTCAKR